MPSDAPNDLFAEVESSFKASMPKLKGLLNLAPVPSRLIGFAAEGIFKGIRLGRDILAKQREANQKLETRIRAESVLRQPILVNLSKLKMRNFFTGITGAVNQRNFPLLSLFTPEIESYKKTDGNPDEETLKVLRAAMTLVPLLKGDPLLSNHPDLGAIFAIGLDPDDTRSVRRLVLEYIRLFPERAESYGDHYARMEGFWKDTVELELLRIDRATLEAQAELNAAVGKLVRGAIFGDQGFAAKSLQFAIGLKLDGITEQIGKLETLKNQETDSAKKQELANEIQKLADQKQRLASLAG